MNSHHFSGRNRLGCLILVGLLGACTDSSSSTGMPAQALQNTMPVAAAGPDQVASTGIPVSLDAAGSADAEGDALTFSWRISAQPASSASLLDDDSTEQPTFTPDLAGSYTFDLVVSDATSSSTVDQVTVVASDNSNSATIGSAGGEMASLDGKVTLSIPANALTADESIVITLITDDQRNDYLGTEFDAVNNIQSVYDMGPNGLEFSAPVTVTFAADGNPVIDEQTLGSSMQFLITSNDGAAQWLNKLTLIADADAGSISLTGTLDHFSPLAYQTISEDVTYGWELFGVPNTIVRDGLSVVTAMIIAVEVGISEATYFDVGSAPKVSFNTDTSREQFQGTSQSQTSQHNYRCDELGTSKFGANLNAVPGTTFEELTELFGASIPSDFDGYRVLIKKEVRCEEPGALANALAPGLFAAPSGLTGIETVQIGTLLNQMSLTAAGGASQDPFMLLAGAEGWSLFNALSGQVVDSAASPNATNPIFGAVLASHEISAGNIAGMIYEFGPGTFGTTLCHYDSEAGEIGSACQLSQGTGIDASFLGGSHSTAQVPFASETRVGVLTVDPESGRYVQDTFEVASGRISGRTMSVARTDPNGPLLVLSNTGSHSQLSLLDPDGTLTRTDALIGQDARKLRCLDSFCIVSIFNDGTDAGALLPLQWDGFNFPELGVATQVGSGPIGVDITRTSNGDYLVASTAFNDRLASFGHYSSTGELVIGFPEPLPEECEQPAHAAFYRPSERDEDIQLVGTCFGSNHYFVKNIDYVEGEGFSFDQDE